MYTKKVENNESGNNSSFVAGIIDGIIVSSAVSINPTGINIPYKRDTAGGGFIIAKVWNNWNNRHGMSAAGEQLKTVRNRGTKQNEISDCQGAINNFVIVPF